MVNDEDTQMNMLIRAIRNTWSRAARRRILAGATDPGKTESTCPALCCRIRSTKVETNERGKARDGNLTLEFEWVAGKDRGLFESFMSHVSQKLSLAMKDSDIDMAV